MEPKRRSRTKYIVSFVISFVICFIVASSISSLPRCSKIFTESYERGFEREFVATCAESVLPKAACQCLFDELRDKHSIVEMSTWALTDFPDDVMEAAVLACDLELEDDPSLE